jgi:hypothetical protein
MEPVLTTMQGQRAVYELPAGDRRMDDHRQQPEGASRQAAGALIGAIIGFGIAARQIFGAYEQAGQLPWVDGLGITMIGAVVGLILATLLASRAPEEKEPKAAEPSKDEDTKDKRTEPADRVNGVQQQDDRMSR